ncbi:MAG: methionyl-tRNA formyltransferase, partial [Gammaproteobacteria bacterium]
MRPLKIIFAGTPEFAVPALQALLDSAHEVCAVYTQPDRPAGRGRTVQASPVKQLALRHRIPVLQPPSLKDASVQETLRALVADLMVVVAYGLILPAAVLSAPRLGCINIHASLLPRWRGAAPIQRAILAGDDQTGITLMQMDEGLDTGAMLVQRPCPILPTDSAKTLHDRLAALGAETLIETLGPLQDGTITARTQNGDAACYAAKLSKPEAVLDWRLDAAALDRKVRAFNPSPVAQGTLICPGREP